MKTRLKKFQGEKYYRDRQLGDTKQFKVHSIFKFYTMSMVKNGLSKRIKVNELIVKEADFIFSTIKYKSFKNFMWKVHPTFLKQFASI